MGKKTRVGILEQALDRYQYQMTLHPNYHEHFREGRRVFFEIIDADGKLKRVVCSVETQGQEALSDEEPENCILRCERVYNVVEQMQCELISDPPAGRVVYLEPQSRSGDAV